MMLPWSQASHLDTLDPPSVPPPSPPATPLSWHSLLGHWDSGWDLLPYKGLVSFLSGTSQVEITFHNVFLLLFSDVLSWLPAVHGNIRTPGAELASRPTNLPTSLLRISLQWEFGLFGNTSDNLGGEKRGGGGGEYQHFLLEQNRKPHGSFLKSQAFDWMWEEMV